MHGHPKLFELHPFAHSSGPCIHRDKFVAALQPQFPFFDTPLLALLRILDRHASLLHHSSITFLVYCCFFCFSTLFFYRSSPIPPTPTKFHHHLHPWIHSTPVTPGSKPLSPHFGGTTHHGFHPKYQVLSKWPLDDLPPFWAPTAYPILLQPSVHGFDLLDTFSSLLVLLVVVSRGRKQAQVSAKFEAHQPPIPLSPLIGLQSFVTQTTQRPHTKFTLH